MKISSYNLRPYPGYEKHIALTLQTDESSPDETQFLQKIIRACDMPEEIRMNDMEIPGTQEGETLRIRVVKPVGLPPKAPIIMDVHGGGFTKGDLDIDNYRCMALAGYTPCIVVSVEYRLATPENHFPASLMDCHTAYLWLTRHGEELGGDPGRIGLHGTSAGGNLCAGLALYLRDHGEQAPALTALICPTLDNVRTASFHQFGPLGSGTADYPKIGYVVYGHLNNGRCNSYYILPGQCKDLRGLGAHMIVTAEYDPLRDEGMNYARNLLENGIPCEILCAPRVTHGFCVVDHPYTRWIHRGIAASFRREFGMEITEI